MNVQGFKRRSVLNKAEVLLNSVRKDFYKLSEPGCYNGSVIRKLKENLRSNTADLALLFLDL
jgi:hypothetical protein